MHLAPRAPKQAPDLLPVFLLSLASKVPNLLHLGVVRRRNAIEVGGDLRSQVLTRKQKVQSRTRQNHNCMGYCMSKEH